METEEKGKIEVFGARVHNLKNVDVEIPHDSLTVITGLSGSGKSSLAFDTIFAEGQRRYLETFSTYARNFLGGMERPDVDKITGLSPVLMNLWSFCLKRLPICHISREAMLIAAILPLFRNCLLG